jgi:hypothetical protein
MFIFIKEEKHPSLLGLSKDSVTIQDAIIFFCKEAEIRECTYCQAKCEEN